MPVLLNSRHEQFAQALIKGLTAGTAYTTAGYAANGSRQNAARLLLRADIVDRVQELQTSVAREVIRQELSDRNVRLQVLQDAYNRLHMLLETRAKDPTMAGVPGGSTGLVVRHF